jgi:hypothetical protein
VQVRARVKDAGAAEAADELAAAHARALVQIVADRVEEDVAADHGTVLVADADKAAGVGAARFVALEALDDPVEDGEHRLAERAAEIDAAVAELALGRPRLRTGGTEAARFVERQRPPRPGQRVEPADHRRQRLGRGLAGAPRSVGDVGDVGRQGDRVELARRIEALEVAGDGDEARARVSDHDTVRVAAEPIAVAAQRAPTVVGEAERDRGHDDAVAHRHDPKPAGRAQLLLAAGQERPEPPAQHQRQPDRHPEADGHARAHILDGAGGEGGREHERRQQRGSPCERPDDQDPCDQPACEPAHAFATHNTRASSCHFTIDRSSM